MIFACLLMKKHGVLLDIIRDSITFFPKFCPHLRTFLFSIPSKLIEETKKISEAKQQQDITPNRILKINFIENLDGFLKTTKKTVKKRRRLANVFKQKLNMGKQKFKTIVINNISNLGKEELPTLTLALTFEKNIQDVAIKMQMRIV